ncbi:MAG TPA: hypothetical protein ENJ23_00465 [Bacteroidetes bacterium]|nr:hypothetical protein [Bacteroidota bacterium]
MDRRVWLGIGLILVGILALIHNVGWVDVTSQFVLAVIMVAIGIMALALYLRQDRSLALLIIGLVTLPWGFGIGLYEIGWIGFGLEGNFFLLGVALGFLAVYLHNDRQWWAVIPGGMLLVFDVVSALQDYIYSIGDFTGFLMFFGFGLVFLYLYLIRDEKNHLGWARYPAWASFLFALFLLYIQTDNRIAQIFVSVVLILIGLGLLLAGRKAGEPEEESGAQIQPPDEAAARQEPPEAEQPGEGE